MGSRTQCETMEVADRTLMEMRPGKVWAGRAPVGGCLRIACESGALWVTGEDGKDHILGPGGIYRTSEPVRVVVEALEDSTAQVTAMGRKEAPWWSFLKGMRLATSP